MVTSWPSIFGGQKIVSAYFGRSPLQIFDTHQNMKNVIQETGGVDL